MTPKTGNHSATSDRTQWRAVDFSPRRDAVDSSSPEGRLTAVCQARIGDWSELRTRRQSEKLRRVSYTRATSAPLHPVKAQISVAHSTVMNTVDLVL